MNKKRLASKLMFTGGIVEIIIGILHFVWPFQFNEPGGFADVSSDYGSAVFLCVICIGLCQIVFGALSIYYSKRLLSSERSAWIYGISQGILWQVRTLFELLLPVRIPFFFLSNPTVFVLPLCFLLGLLFLVPLLTFKNDLLRNQEVL
jgi:uncharacterized membrane protein HdeD (DUF308 family)